MYTLQWSNPALPGKAAINVNAASTNSISAPVVLTGKGSSNYGQIQQQNMLRMLENFASDIEPAYPTLGQLWYNSDANALSVCTSIAPVTWESLGGIQITNAGVAPIQANLGDLWFEKTGNYSGILYAYTGTGRYPSTAWDADVSAAIPDVSPLVAPYSGIRINRSTFSNTDFNEAYIHGFTGSTAADVDGTIDIAGVSTPMPRGVLQTYLPGNNFIVWDTTSTMVSTQGSPRYFQVREVGLDNWEYDNNSTWVPVTPVAGMYVIGTVSVAEYDDNTAPGITAATIWIAARNLTDFRFCKLTSTTGGVGGWNQIWPPVQSAGARFEYDEMYGQLLNLIGSPYTFGGCDAVRGLPLTDFQTMDTALNAFHIYQNNLAQRDSNFAPANGTSASFIAAEPNSIDWDYLLAAARWSLNRLDIPTSLVDAVSEFPFVQDGRVAPSVFTQEVSSNPISLRGTARATNRIMGSITLSRLYTETMNALLTASSMPYTLKGMAGTNSTITSFDPNIASYTHATYTGLYTGSAATYHYLKINFLNDDEYNRFVNGGSAVDVVLSYNNSTAGVNANWNSFLTTNNRVRITADKCFILSTANALSVAPTSTGFRDSQAQPNYNGNIATVASGGQSITVNTAVTPSVNGANSTLWVRVQLLAPAGLTGTTTISYRIVRDTQTFGADEAFFPKPRAFVAGTDTPGSSIVWVNSPVVAPPVVNFTATPSTGPGPLAVTFSYTGTGSPTLVEWDPDGNGTYNGTGNTYAYTYTNFSSATFTVRCRATNAAGQDVLTRPSYITTT